MGRWDPDAAGRLQQAAMTLYLQRGYAGVTVAEIAATAGLTKRTFFRYFADKREVLFAGAAQFEARVVAAVGNAAGQLAPVEAAVHALTEGAAQLEQYGQYARARRELVASSTDLQERELIKTAALTTAVAGALRERGADAGQAHLAAHAAVTAFTTGYDRWVDTDGTTDLPALIWRCLEDLREAIRAA